MERDVLTDFRTPRPCGDVVADGVPTQQRENCISISPTFTHEGCGLVVDIQILLPVRFGLPEDDSGVSVLRAYICPSQCTDVAIPQTSEAPEQERPPCHLIGAWGLRQHPHLVNGQIYAVGIFITDALDAGVGVGRYQSVTMCLIDDVTQRRCVHRQRVRCITSFGDVGNKSAKPCGRDVTQHHGRFGVCV